MAFGGREVEELAWGEGCVTWGNVVCVGTGLADKNGAIIRSEASLGCESDIDEDWEELEP